MGRLGLIAGGGALPVTLAEGCERSGRSYFVVRLKGFADPALKRHPGADVGLAEVGRCIETLKAAGCASVCFAGIVTRPDFGALKPDLKGLSVLPGIVAAARHGDDALLRAILSVFEKEGFEVEGAQSVLAELTIPEGAMGAVEPGEHVADVRKALTVAAAVGALDAGQGAVVCDGLVLALEAQEGTDAMLRRVAELPQELRGAPGAGRGVLAKAPKPIQEERVDLPTIGVRTVELAHAAGLAGIAGRAGSLLVLDREAVVETADRLGLFIWGDPAEPPA